FNVPDPGFVHFV
ncbi:proton antiporter-2 family protein, partial [Vibrio parahaemolyticus VP2007-007]